MKKGFQILICDDETGIRESLKMILEREYALAFASNGEEVVRYVKRHPPDLVIMDIKMPRLGGLEALPKIKKLRRHLPVLIITGYESRDVATEAVQRGADDYLTKPFDREKVTTKVRVLLGQK